MVMTPAGGVFLIGGRTGVISLVSVVEEFLDDLGGWALPSIMLLHSNRSNTDTLFG